MRSVPLLEDNYYHVFNRGNQKQVLFHDKADYIRFLYLLLFFQSDISLPQTHRHVASYSRMGTFAVKADVLEQIVTSRTVAVLSFSIMPNHFHVLLKNIYEDGLSKYMHRVCSAYATYFNKRYERSGHVFQGTFKSVLIESDEQLVYNSAYIHRNPHELAAWKDASAQYPWSSYQDYVAQNRWGKLLDIHYILNTFKDENEYRAYVETSGAKEEMKVHK